MAWDPAAILIYDVTSGDVTIRPFREGGMKGRIIATGVSPEEIAKVAVTEPFASTG